MDDAGGEPRRQRLREPRVAVAERVHRDAGERVEVLAAVLVPEPDAFAADEGDVLSRVRVHEVGHQYSQSKTAAPAAVRKILAEKPKPGSGLELEHRRPGQRAIRSSSAGPGIWRSRPANSRGRDVPRRSQRCAARDAARSTRRTGRRAPAAPRVCWRAVFRSRLRMVPARVPSVRRIARCRGTPGRARQTTARLRLTPRAQTPGSARLPGRDPGRSARVRLGWSTKAVAPPIRRWRGTKTKATAPPS